MTPEAGSRPPLDGTELVEVLDRVLDRGIVIDAEFRLNVAGLAVAGIECRFVVAYIETYLEYAEEVGEFDASDPASWPLLTDDGTPPERPTGVVNRLKSIRGDEWGGFEYDA